MKTSEQTDKIDTAVAAIQAAMAPLTKNKTIKIDSRSGDGWSSGYITLPALHEAARPLLEQHGIAVYQGGGFVQGLGPTLETRLALNGQYVESFFPVKTSKDGAQGFGGGIAFARRWGLLCALGIVAEDAEEGQGYKDAKNDARAPRKAAAPAGLPDHLAAIRDASSLDTFEAAARAARSKHPSGEAASAVEHAISDKLVAVLDGLTNEGDLDKLTAIKDRWQRIAPRGGDARQALQRAASRVEPRP